MRALLGAVPLLLLLSLAEPASGEPARPCGLPWAFEGQASASWSIASCEASTEFIRVFLERPGTRAGLEVAFAQASGSEWETRYYRVQPVQGLEIPLDVARELLAALRVLEEEQGHVPLVSRARTGASEAPRPADLPPRIKIPMPDRVHGTGLRLWHGAVLLSGALALFVLVQAFRFRRRRGWSLGVAFRAGLRAALVPGMWVAIMVPLVFVLWTLAGVVQSVVKLNRLDPRELLAGVESTLAYRGPLRPLTFRDRDGIPSYLHETNCNTPSRDVSIDPAAEDVVAYVYGGSSVVLPSVETAFPAVLERLWNEVPGRRMRVFNFGACALDSFEIRNRIEGCLGVRKPDVLIVYSGHNEYTNVYHLILKNSFLPVRQSPLLVDVIYLVYRFGFQKGIQEHPERAFEHFLSQRIEPRLLRWLQAAGLVRLPVRDMDIFDRALLAAWEKNVQAIIGTARDAGVPVVFVTPIGNLEFDAVGIDGEAENLYRRGMDTEDYGERMALLLRARDVAYFSQTIRARTPLLETLRRLDEPGVHVFDLERALLARRFSFGQDAFVDEVHLTESGQQTIALLLRNFLERLDLVPRT